MAAKALEAVFLSASIPEARRHPRYYLTADIAAIREAVVAVASLVLPRRCLIFGGHPAISPLVLLIAKRLGLIDRVVIYQSEFFRSAVPPDSLAFPLMNWVAANADIHSSLAAMRREMLQHGSLSAGVFVGGMEGVEEEYALFQQLHPRLPAYPIASTGAAAKVVFDSQPPQMFGPVVRQALQHDIVYDALLASLPGVG